MSKDTYVPFEFNGKSYNEPIALINAMGKSWRLGKQILFTGELANYYKKFDRNWYLKCQNAVSSYQNNPKLGDVIFLKWICKIEGIKNLYWRGRNYGNVPQMIDLLNKNDNDFKQLVSFMIREQLLSVFLKNSGCKAELVENVHYLERCYVRKDCMFDKKKTTSLLRIILSETKTFSFEGTIYRREADFAKHLQQCADVSKRFLDAKIEKLYSDDYNLIPEFEGWLINLGKTKELSLWRDKYQSGTLEEEDEEEFVFTEDEEEHNQAQNKANEEFSKEIFGFENDFYTALSEYTDSLQSPKRFEALMKDLFPEKALQTYLILTLYKMDITTAIQNAVEINSVFISRFIKRLRMDFGIKEEFAQWAVSVWCVCYGEKILQKVNRIPIYKVL